MGEGEGSESVPAGAHHEPNRTEQDRRRTARPVGQGEGAAEEGGLTFGLSTENKGPGLNRALFLGSELSSAKTPR